jgi:Ca2+-binding RTX toxin-like protein
VRNVSKRTTRLLLALSIGSVGALAAPPATAAPSCFGEPATIVGTSEADDVVGTSGRDVVVLRGGDDTVRTRGGSDLVCGGDGADFLELGTGPDRAKGGNGQDGIFGGWGDDRLLGGRDMDGLAGGNGTDVSKGEQGGDFLADGFGDDRLAGGPAADVLNGGNGDDRIMGGIGDFDLVSYLGAPGPVVVDLALTPPQPTGQGLDRISAVEGAEGSGFDDSLFGNDLDTQFGNGLFGLGGDDMLNGRQRVDFVFGEGGDDTLFGGAGQDDLTGGEEDEDETGDFGSGGPGNDVCRELETDDGTCEQIETAAGKWRATAARGESLSGPAREALRLA